ncbi:hypothetical protein, variant 4 [Exophiala mesophila]|uniref:fructose-2,6-bisphosphate 2-phosphatase n=1 Tax=Exophiala mesophila TaxID=212818 RepID=A0A0D2AGQ3_EXOME|nr:hypothetical protein, variant 3 [Exophiala mesophila]XP_016229682.1 hypothetical protein, variant 4 [Exophiala mesophila]KIV98107.1 hypothetical protein, variant 3 [Exophiala mesophila]KIV98108.1 hypothetical protein, variant 4 [Exophiala mesophila]
MSTIPREKRHVEQQQRLLLPICSTGSRIKRTKSPSSMPQTRPKVDENGSMTRSLKQTYSVIPAFDYVTKLLTLVLDLFVESKCDDEDLIMSNILEVKTSSPDYVGQDPEEAARDFRDRIRNYEKVYQTIDESEKHLTYVKIINIGARTVINLIQDYLQSRLVYYLTNLHIKPRSIWLSRHGESEYNLEGKIGGDANISERGDRYARLLPELVKRSGLPKDAPLTIWTSTLRRTSQTAQYLVKELGWEKLQWKALDELDSGVCDGMTYQEIADKYPEDFQARDDDKYNYRYRGGESYRDVVIRLEPIIMELERSENIIIITHQAIVRCIYAYFMEIPQEKSPWMEVPLHTLMKLTPKAYGTQVDKYKADIPAVSTWRPKGSTAKHHDSVSEGVPEVRVGDKTSQKSEPPPMTGLPLP